MKNQLVVLTLLLFLGNLSYGQVTEEIPEGGISDIDVGTLYDDQDTLGPPPGNPYVMGLRGNWRVKRSYNLVMERDQRRSGTNDNVNTRKDGAYNDFFPFWNTDQEDNSTWFVDQYDYWTLASQINYYSPFGSALLESVDPLARYSATIYGYNHSFPIGAAANARYREIGFDGFEDYAYGKCANDHFNFKDVGNSKITQSTSHSGRYSIRLVPSEVVILKKEFAPCEPEEFEEIIR